MDSRDTSELITQVRFGFVHGSFPIFVTNAHLSPVSHKILKKRKERLQWHLLTVIMMELTHIQISLVCNTTRGRANLSH